MLEIEAKGANAVIISTKQAKAVFDPKLSDMGLKDIDVDGAIEVTTEDRFFVEGDYRIHIDGPGEYEIGDMLIKGIPAVRHIDTESQGKKSTIYTVKIGDVRIAVFGNVSDKISDDQIETLGMVDILIIPVGGGGYTLDSTSAVSIIRRIEPKVVIPVHFADKGLKYEVPQADFETFNKELAAPIELTNKYKLKSYASLPESLTLIGLTRDQ